MSLTKSLITYSKCSFLAICTVPQLDTIVHQQSTLIIKQDKEIKKLNRVNDYLLRFNSSKPYGKLDLKNSAKKRHIKNPNELDGL